MSCETYVEEVATHLGIKLFDETNGTVHSHTLCSKCGFRLINLRCVLTPVKLLVSMVTDGQYENLMDSI